MSAPYWGKLPSPKIVKNRRMSDDDPQSLLGQDEVDPAAVAAAGAPYYDLHQHQSLHDHNTRASVQTALTAAPTETTFSPSYESPTASALAPQGLAPRPPSYQRPRAFDPAPAANPADERQFASEDVVGGEEFSPASPLAPEHHRRPSTRHKHANGRSDSMEAPQRHQQHGAAARGYSDLGPPLPVPERRRKKSTMPKSPLQRLELTLDSMTKEEKRARIEAAERRARERQAREAGLAEPTQPQPEEQLPARRPSQSQAQKAPVDYNDARPTHAAAPPVAQPVPRETYQQPPSRSQQPATRAPVQQQQQPPPQHQYRQYDDDDRGYGAPVPFSAREIPRAAPTREPETQHELPKRNLSFRERAARDDIKLPGAEEVPAVAAAAHVSSVQEPPAPKKGFGFSLTRSGSNKLKKNPPGDPWYQVRRDSEQRAAPPAAHQISVPAASADTHQQQQRSQPQQRGYQLQDQGGYQEPAFTPGHGRRPSAAAAPVPNRFAVNPAPEEIQPIQRRATEPVRHRQHPENSAHWTAITQAGQAPGALQETPRSVEAAAAPRKSVRLDESVNITDGQHHSVASLAYDRREHMEPGNGLYKPPVWLDEWKRATVGKLAGPLLDLSEEPEQSAERNKAWWEESGRRRSSSYTSRAKQPDAYEGEHEFSSGPTRFKPQLYLECGPLLRYCGIRSEKVPARNRGGPATTKEMWRGTVMIVTRDSDSSYELAPSLRLFVQDLELLPAPPHQVNGDLSPEYVDPIGGHPKLGRRGETLYVRPVDHLQEGKDLSSNETDSGLFETTRSAPDMLPPDGSADWPGTFTSRIKRVEVDGEKLQKTADVKGFRLHAERGCTFWRFNIEVELASRQQRVAYRINKGPSMSFWVPAKETAMNIMFHSCNGFSIGTKTDMLSGPDPMWRDVLNTHQSSPFHVMVGGGDQIYNDSVADECDLLIDWLEMHNPADKHNAPFTAEMQVQLEDFYFRRYCTWFSSGLFGLASSQIPMVNIWSDRESFNGFGSFPHKDMNSPVLSGLGAVSFKYYMLFQHQSIIPETEVTEPSWVLGAQPGPYVNELSRSVYVSLGAKVALLAADCRTERTEEDVIHSKTWERVMNRLYAEVRRGIVEHLLVVFPVPVAYPRLVWLENVIRSRAMNPVKALGRKGLLGNAFNNLENGSEVLDDLRDHWTAKNHKEERQIVIEDLQDLAIDKSLRVTILSGDVNLAAVGQFYSNPKLGLPKHKDPRYIPNIISSAITNAPPPDLMVDALNRRHKVHHFDKQTDEAMIPMFQHGVDGKARNNKRLLPHRNWCSIRQWQPGATPPSTPPPVHEFEESPSPPPSAKPSLLRRLSLGSSDRPNMSRDSVRGPRPPVSGGGLLRSISRRLSRSEGTDGAERPSVLKRTMSWGRGDGQKQEGQKQEGQKRSFFSLGRRGSQSRPDDGGINGQWGVDSEEDDYDEPQVVRHPGHPQPSGLRGGAAYEEYSDGDDSYFMAAPPQRANTIGANPAGHGGFEGGNPEDEIPPQALRPFHRTPTGLSTKQMKKADQFEVDLEGGLDICLNVEVNPKDPTGITVPYRLLVPKLFYEYTPEVDEIPVEEPSRFKKLLSIRRKKKAPAEEEDEPTEEEQYDDEEGYDDLQVAQQQAQQAQQQQRGNGRFFGR